MLCLVKIDRDFTFNKGRNVNQASFDSIPNLKTSSYISRSHGPRAVNPECISLLLPLRPSPPLTTKEEMAQLDPNNEQQMRAFIRKTTVPYFKDANSAFKQHVKTALQWLLNGGYESTYPNNNGFEVLTNDPDRCLPVPNNLKDLYIWIWKEISDETESWEIDNFSNSNYEIIDYDTFLSAVQNN
jgi:hypothetical protein